MKVISRHFIQRMALLSGMAMMPQPVMAETVPGHLAQMTRQVLDHSDSAVKAMKRSADAAHVKTIEAGMAAIKKARVSSWSSKSIELGKPYRHLAGLIGLDPDSSKTFDVIQSLTKLVGEPLSEKIQDVLSDNASQGKIDEVAQAVEDLRSAGGGETHHALDLGEGERVEIDWTPQTAELVVTALKETGTPDDYELSLHGNTEMSRNPETGEPQINAVPDEEKPPQALTAREIEDRKASILGTWENDQFVWVISAAREEAGYVKRSSQTIRKEIDALRQEIEELQHAVEYMWVDGSTGEIVRQEKFRRLGEPWIYKGEQSIVPDAKAQIATKEKKIADLEAEVSGSDRPLAERLDPVAFERVKATPAARVLHIDVSTKGAACTYSFSEAYFDGRLLVGRRTHDNVCAMNKSLPPKIRSELIASWAPPHWLVMRANYANGAELTLEGAYWGMRVAYDPDAMTVSRIFEPYASDEIAFLHGGGKAFVALGAAESLWP